MSPGPLIAVALLCRCAAADVPYELLAEFTRPGAQPLAPLVQGADGGFYGTASGGGAYGHGCVFRVTPAGAVTTVVSFTGTGGSAPGSGPDSGLIRAGDGTFYGVTPSGGGSNFGTVFRVTAAGQFNLLYSFSGGAGGSVPHGLMQHSDGNFYGVTMAGGSGGFGTVYRLSAAGALTTLVEFTGSAGARKGSAPAGVLTAGGNSLYGVTREGGAANLGTVFSITTAGAWTLLAEFTGTAGAKPGANPGGGLFLHTDGAFYGLTEWGGANSFGSAFKITPAGAFTSLRSFADASGSQPAGALVRGGDGNFYGVTAAGGASGLGTLFRMAPGGGYTVLTHFTGETGTAPGAVPRCGLTVASDGDLYGTTSAGGPGNPGMVIRLTTGGGFSGVASFSLPQGWMPSGAPVLENAASLLFPMAAGGTGGGGTLLRLTPGGFLTVAGTFGTAGSNPAGGLMPVGADFYGVTVSGGTSGRGTAFKFNSAAGISTVANYTTVSGSLAEGPLTPGSDGAIYGVGREGGTVSRGTLYKLTTAGVRTRLISFTGVSGAAKGSRPRAPLVLAANAKFYGVTETGGASDQGTLFSLSASGALSTLAEFTPAGPRNPLGGLVAAADGLVYGTLSAGGASDAGVLFSLNPATNAWNAVASFAPATTGSRPGGSLLAGPDGAIYGTTATGGPGGAGTVWRFTPAGGLETLAAFTGESGPVPGRGRAPDGTTGGLAFGSDGKLYGTTPAGGGDGGGTAFRLSLSTPYENWLQAELGDAHAPDLGDPDADGLPNLLEYALILSPSTASTGNLPGGEMMEAGGNRYLSVTVPRDPARPDVTITVEAASHLDGPWLSLASSSGGQPFSGPGYTGGDPPAGGVRQVTIRDTAAVAVAPRRFLRIRATR